MSGDNAQKAYAETAQRLANYRMNNQQTTNNEQTVVVNQPATDPYEDLKKLKELLDMGIVTQEEFDKKKKEILGL